MQYQCFLVSFQSTTSSLSSCLPVSFYFICPLKHWNYLVKEKTKDGKTLTSGCSLFFSIIRSLYLCLWRSYFNFCLTAINRLLILFLSLFGRSFLEYGWMKEENETKERKRKRGRKRSMSYSRTKNNLNGGCTENGPKVAKFLVW